MFSWRNLSRGVKAVFFVQIVNRMGDFVFPFLTLLLSRVRGLNVETVGLIVSASLALQAAGGLAAGKLSDSHGRKPILLVFLFTSATLLAAAGLWTDSVISTVLVVCAAFFFGAMRPVLSALVADLSAEPFRRPAFTLSYWGINIGVGIGGLVAGFLFTKSIPLIFWIDSATTYLALVLIAVFVPGRVAAAAQSAQVSTPDPVSETDGESAASRRWESFRAFAGRRVLLGFALIVPLYNLVYAQMIFTLPLEADSLFGKNGPMVYGLVWSVNAVSVLLLTPLFLNLTKRLRPLENMAIGMAVFAAGVCLMIFRPGLALVFLSTVLWTSGEVLFSICYGEFISGESPQAMRGRFQAIAGFGGSLGFMFSPILSGALARSLGLGGVWILASITVAVAALGFVFLRRLQLRASPSS